MRRLSGAWVDTQHRKRIGNGWQSLSATRRISGEWVGYPIIQPDEIIRNLVSNPRGKSSGGTNWGASISWSNTPVVFRTNLTGWSHGTTTAASVTIPAANSSQGNLVSFTPNDPNILQNVAVGATLPITVQASRSLGNNLILAFVWLTSTGSWIGETTTPWIRVTPGSVNTLTMNVTRPAQAVRFIVQVRSPNPQSGEVLSVTNVCVGSAEFFDGNTQDTNNKIYEWTGTPDASVSVASKNGLPPPPVPNFSADVAEHGLTRYQAVHNSEGITVVNDPVLGSERKVLKMTTLNTYNSPTLNPRTQVETAHNLVTGQDVFTGWSVLFPSDFPNGFSEPEGFISLGSVYGPSYAGKGPTGIGISRTGNLMWQRNDSYGYDTPWTHAITRNVWHDFVHRIKLSENPEVGFVELYLNTGNGWEQQLLNGHTRLYMKTLDHTNRTGPNRHSLSNYWAHNQYESITMFFADHKVGPTREYVEPNSHNNN